MKINVDLNDPYFPSPYKLGEKCRHYVQGGRAVCQSCQGVTIRLKLAAEMANGILAGCGRAWDMSQEERTDILYDAEAMADEMVARMNRANRDEGKAD